MIAFHTRNVLLMCGIREDEATVHEISLAEEALERCYYEQHAAEWLTSHLRRYPAETIKEGEA